MIYECSRIQIRSTPFYTELGIQGTEGNYHLSQALSNNCLLFPVTYIQISLSCV